MTFIGYSNKEVKAKREELFRRINKIKRDE